MSLTGYPPYPVVWCTVAREIKASVMKHQRWIVTVEAAITLALWEDVDSDLEKFRHRLSKMN